MRGSTVRTVATRSTGRSRSSWAAYASSRREVRSDQCRSSSTTTTGAGWPPSHRETAAKVRSVVAAAAPASGASPASSVVVPSSRAVTSGGTSSAVPARSRSTDSHGQYGGARSASWHRPTQTRAPRSRPRCTTSVASMLLPIPASPLITRTPPRPVVSRSASAAWIEASAPARPTTPLTRARVASAGADGAVTGGGSGARAGAARAGSCSRICCSRRRTEADGSTPSSSTRAERRVRRACRASACRSQR